MSHPRKAPNCFDFVAVCVLGDKNLINRFTVEYGGVAPLSSSEALSLTNQLGSTYRANFIGVMSNDGGYDHGEGSDIDPLGVYTEMDSVSATGGVAEHSLPAQVAVCNHWLAPVARYRGGKPRTYLGLVPNTVTTDARTLTSGAVSSYSMAFANFLSNVNALTVGGRSVRMVTLAFQRGHTFLPSPLVTAVSGGSLNTLLRTQRRRNRAA